ncbi:MAG: hypothetical protein ACE360_06410 [Hyphomicrobiales bacterium]
MLGTRTPFQWVMLALALLIGLALVAVLGFRTLTEASGTNSYALIAESFLTGTPWASACFDIDCAQFEGRTYIVFPPFPGVVAMPLVALSGIETTGFMLIGLAGLLLSLFLWKRIFDAFEMEGEVQLWLLIALAFASPLFYVGLRADGVWFFAQIVGFPLLTLALHEAIYGRLVTAGIALGCALLCRQMSVFYAPLLLLIAIGPSAPLFRMDWYDVRERFGWVLQIGIPVAIGLVGYFAYNYWRFGDPLETGYSYIFYDFAPDPETGETPVLTARVRDHGVWSSAYVLYNAAYLLVQGFDITFDAAKKLTITGLDNGGTSVLAASPWLLFLAFTPWRRLALFCLLIIAGFATLLLFYHSNGFTQYNTQRYILDWLPAALLMLALAKDKLAEHKDVLALLVLWGMALNVVTVAVLALTVGA